MQHDSSSIMCLFKRECVLNSACVGLQRMGSCSAGAIPNMAAWGIPWRPLKPR